MASIAKSSGGSVRVFFYDKAGRRKAVHLGRVSDDIAEGVCRRVERILNAQIHGEEPSRNDSEWLAKSGLRKKFVAVGLVEPLLSDAKAEIPTLEAFIRSYIERRASKVKPASVTVWTQVQRNLLDLIPKDIRLDKITVGHAKDFHESLRAKGMKTSTISKRIGFCRQFQAAAETQAELVINPTQQGEKPCDKSDSAGRTQGTRKEPFDQGKRRERGGFRQLLLVLEAEDKGFEPSTGFPAPDFESGS